MTESSREMNPPSPPEIAGIDADVLLYECSAIAEDRETGETKSFDFVKEVFDGRIEDICKATGVRDYQLYITGSGNFREQVAVSAPYKGNRKEEKPFHYYNLKAYMEGHHKCTVVKGMEADDMMSIDQVASGDKYVICTRDKDLRQVPGWHYGWECGRQPEYKLRYVTDPGTLELSKDRKKVVGTGIKFFWAQMLTGDTVDNIPGLPGWGPVAAYDMLYDPALTVEEMEERVSDAYRLYKPEGWEDYMLEQGRLLWMVRAINDDGPVMWELPDYVSSVFHQ